MHVRASFPRCPVRSPPCTMHHPAPVHQAKGREWPVVFVPNLVEGELPLEGAEIEEVRCLSLWLY